MEKALHKVAVAAKKLNASIHLPRIGIVFYSKYSNFKGFGMKNFKWYTVERIIKKCLSNRGLPTFIYYFNPKITQLPKKEQNDDIFEGLKIGLYKVDDTKKYKRLLISNGAIVEGYPFDVIIFV